MTNNSTSFLCNHCGAPLNVAPHTRFCTCSFCGSHLKIHQEGGSVFSEVLSEIQERTARIEEDVQVIRLQNELELLDRNWEKEELRLSTAKKDGTYRKPQQGSSLTGGIIAIVFGLVWAGFVANMNDGSPFALFGLVFVGFGIYNAINGSRKEKTYRQNKAVYEQKRRELLRRIGNAGK